MSACRRCGEQNIAHLEHFIRMRSTLVRGVLQFAAPVVLTPPLTLTTKLRVKLSTSYSPSSRLCDGEIHISGLVSKRGASLLFIFAEPYSN